MQWNYSIKEPCGEVEHLPVTDYLRYSGSRLAIAEDWDMIPRGTTIRVANKIKDEHKREAFEKGVRFGHEKERDYPIHSDYLQYAERYHLQICLLHKIAG